MSSVSATPAILCLNSGSSSLKFVLYQLSNETPLAAGAVERIGLPDGRLWIRGRDTSMLKERHEDVPNQQAAVHAALTAFEQVSLPQPAAVGRRLVHGGASHIAPERVTPQLVASLRRLVSFAPLHLPGELEGIDAITTHYPDLPQVVCFDTAFHRRMPQIAQRFPLPRPLWDEGIRRYGFHGLSYEYIVETLGTTSGRTIIAHLGNGASMAAVRDGQPLDTTNYGLHPGGRPHDGDPERRS